MELTLRSAIKRFYRPPLHESHSLSGLRPATSGAHGRGSWLGTAVAGGSAADGRASAGEGARGSRGAFNIGKLRVEKVGEATIARRGNEIETFPNCFLPPGQRGRGATAIPLINSRGRQGEGFSNGQLSLSSRIGTSVHLYITFFLLQLSVPYSSLIRNLRDTFIS